MASGFFKFAVNLVGLLFIKLILSLMCKANVHLTHELILCSQINIRRADLTNTPWWKHLDGAVTFQPRLKGLVATASLQDLAIFMALHNWGPHSSGKYSGGPLSEITKKQSRTPSRFSQRLYTLKEICCPSAWLICTRNRAWLWFCQQHQEIPSSHPSKF